MLKLLHKYVRRVIAWASTPSMEEEAKAKDYRRRAHLQFSLGPHPRAGFYDTFPLERLPLVAADIQFMAERKMLPETCSVLEHLAAVEAAIAAKRAALQ